MVSWTVLISLDGSDADASSGFEERSCSIWSEVRPFCSKKVTLRSREASRIDSSSRNLRACSRRGSSDGVEDEVESSVA